jgi:hypothetical protein
MSETTRPGRRNDRRVLCINTRTRSSQGDLDPGLRSNARLNVGDLKIMAKILETKTADGSYDVAVFHDPDGSIRITSGFSSSAVELDTKAAKEVAKAILDALPKQDES